MSLGRKWHCVVEQLGGGMSRLRTKLTKDGKGIKRLILMEGFVGRGL